MSCRIGANGKLYRNTGTYAVPVWDLVPNVKDIEAPLDFTDVDVSSRLGGGFKQHEPGMGDITLSLTMLYDPADVDMTVFITAAWTRLAVELLIMDDDQAIAGSQGIRASFKFFKSARKEALDGVMEQMFDLKLCCADNPPAYVVS